MKAMLVVLFVLGSTLLADACADTQTGPGPGPLTASGDASGAFKPNFGDCQTIDGNFGSTHTEIDVSGKDVSMTINGKLYKGTGVSLINNSKTLLFQKLTMKEPGGGSITLNGALDCGK